MDRSCHAGSFAWDLIERAATYLAIRSELLTLFRREKRSKTDQFLPTAATRRVNPLRSTCRGCEVPKERRDEAVARIAVAYFFARKYWMSIVGWEPLEV